MFKKMVNHNLQLSSILLKVQISTCDVCQRMNQKLTTGVPQLHPVVSSWYCIGMDSIGPLFPTADDGSKYILTISDYFSKYVEAIPTPG